MKSRPFRLAPSFREKVWGATALGPWFQSSSSKVGEVWFTTQENPILVKFIFTSERLSVQVHPDDAYALRHEASPGKTEMWHILRAEEGARIALGLRETITRERLRQASLSGDIEGLLAWFAVQPGDTYFVPAGTVHAIDPGIALVEIQQNSDITYRLYDYGRPRELHLEKALAVAHLGPHPGRSVPAGNLLASCDYFVTEKLGLSEAINFRPDPERSHLLVVLKGSGTLAEQLFRPGEVWLIPAGAEPFSLQARGGAELLRTYVPRR